MIGVRSMVLIGLGAAVLIAGLLLLGGGSRVSSDDVRATDRVPVPPAARVEGVSAGPSPGGVPRESLPPKSFLSFRGASVSSAGEILGAWEPEGLFAESSESHARGRADGPLTLSDGNLLKVPAGSEPTFVYGGEPGSINFLDAMAFRVGQGALLYGEDTGALLLQPARGDPARPVVLPVSRPELAGRTRARIEAALPPGVYVVSVAAAVSEGGARYNFRVAVE